MTAPEHENHALTAGCDDLYRVPAQLELIERKPFDIVADLNARARAGERFGVIAADPPWTFVTRSAKGKGRSAEQHYECMTLEDIKALPVAAVAADRCALFLWTTCPLLPAAFEVIEAWGFTYSTVGFLWAKRTPTDDGWHIGMGYSTRSNVEPCLLATRGSPERLSKSVRQLVVAPVREHSRKPEEILHRIRALYPGPYLELFARADGWTRLGNEA
jgi:N6-adenosine-specific RNA methylase IME4